MTLLKKYFNTIAPTYERTNFFVSLGVYSVWHRRFVQRIQPHITSQSKVLDLCSGTGTVAVLLLKNKLLKNLTCIDFSAKMLEEAAQRLPKNVQLIEANAENLPCPNSQFDILCMSFGLRNILCKDLALREMRRVIKNDGSIFLLELIPPRNPIFRFLHVFYMRYIVPYIGYMSTGYKEPYMYLNRSIQDFSLDRTEKVIAEAGFDIVEKQFFSFGLCVYMKLVPV